MTVGCFNQSKGQGQEESIANISQGPLGGGDGCKPCTPSFEDDRTGLSVDTLRRAIADNLCYIQGKSEAFATCYDLYMALAYTIRDRMVQRWISTVESYVESAPKMLYYLSAEYLMGRQLANNLLNLHLTATASQALAESGFTLEDLLEQEIEPGLGNGGLGRLAACFLDSLATLEYPAVGFGIRYEFGIFEQAIRDGWQVERPDRWLRLGNPWEIRRPECTYEVKLGGQVRKGLDQQGGPQMEWIPEQTIIGMAYDSLVPGYDTNTVNTLRLWSAGASKDFDLRVFNEGDFVRAVENKIFSENISKVLYPNDNTPQGRELRLKQQYFFVACSLYDIFRFFSFKHDDLRLFPEKTAIQLNDTHPAVAVAELMRIFVDDKHLPWELSWDLTQKSLGYTNHTLLSEALERWPVDLFRRWLPRHLEIIFEINHRFLEEIQVRFPHDGARLQRLSLIEEGEEKRVRMAHLATLGSHAVNGVAALHSQLLKKEVLKDFYELWPERFSNKTNGITPRRWLLLCNPRLVELINSRIGEEWVKDISKLRKLEALVDDQEFVTAWQQVKRKNKEALAQHIKRTLMIEVDPTSLFDIQVKRIHEYKRQLLNIFHIITLYNRLRANSGQDVLPRTFIFGGKAAPGYHTAKLIIKLANNVAAAVNSDSAVNSRLKVVFLPNFSVSQGELVYPAADLSEQISTAGKEASGTGNMKFALNGALTIGTFDGANIEIRDAVGPENFFLFGLKVEEIGALKDSGYVPMEHYQRDHELRMVMDQLASGYFSPEDTRLFEPLVDGLLGYDQYMVCGDYRAYVMCQEDVARAYRNQAAWTRKSILNTARIGYFSSDRTISEYAQEIWGLKPQQIKLKEYNQAEAGLRRRTARLLAHSIQGES
ncbi:MAG: glycogen/starch/alpha-glucan phosphorylase [Deltaproteobacteria bacterium]|nr:glycogen/starch/alpha-glucan phosphorylase [Deltaproteobacteria bacterium]